MASKTDAGNEPDPRSERPAADKAQEASGAPVPAGTQVSPSAGPARVTHDTEGEPVDPDEGKREASGG